MLFDELDYLTGRLQLAGTPGFVAFFLGRPPADQADALVLTGVADQTQCSASSSLAKRTHFISRSGPREAPRKLGQRLRGPAGSTPDISVGVSSALIAKRRRLPSSIR